MFFYPRKRAFRAGYVSGTQWDDANVGLYSTATGIHTTASGSYSTAMGGSTLASGNYSTAMGSSTSASGIYSTTLGLGTDALGSSATAMGAYTIAESGYETVLGRYNAGYTPASRFGWDAADRLFVVGNGTSNSSRSNAMVILKNGNMGIGNSTPTNKLDVDGQIRMRNGATNGYIVQGDANGVMTWVDPKYTRSWWR